MIAIVAIFTIVFASCSKDVIDNPVDVSITAQQGDSHIVSYYAITDNEGIGFTSTGIEYQYLQNGKHKWLLGYEDIAQQLELDIENFEKIRITRDRILKNGLWRFAVSFDTQDQKDSYYIDVDPETGKIVWVISITDMPGGEFTLSISVGPKE